MNWKTWVPLVLAIVMGVVAAKLVRDLILKKQGAAVVAGKFTKVVVTKGDIQPGKELTAADLTLAPMDNDHMPATSFKVVEEVVGRVSEALMVKGQPVVEAMLAPAGAGSGLQALVPAGMRAVSLEVNEFSGVAGLLTPGCRVDVIATIDDGSGAGKQIAKTIVQNVKVTAVGQKTTTAGNEPAPPGELFKSVTLIASPEDAEAIELAASTGKPRLTLRGGRDSNVFSSDGTSINDLKGNGSAGVNPFVEMLANLKPTTQPAAATTQPIEAVARREPAQRVVKLIKAGVSSDVALDALDGTPSNAFGTTDAGDPFRN
jgi:pilus assembly protein CpaB